jgi:DNA-binding response OmpR family regulator
MRLLIVEDEQALVKPVKKFLEKRGFAVDTVDNGKDAIQYAKETEYDCILLDLNLPEIDGITVANILRKDDISTPIIMVTARSQIYNKLEGFDNGADDYITKPFDLNELVARVNAVIKRASRNSEEILTFGEYEIYVESNKVINTKKGKEIGLSNKEMGILEYLLRNKNTIISSEEILEHVWDREIDMFTDTVKTHIKTLRQKIDPKKQYLKTVRGKGYILES